MTDNQKYYSGFVTILGIPNAGKSTLLNTLFSEKLAIVSHKPQTTRKLTKGIYTENNHQFVFIDTPGYHETEKLWNRLINIEIEEAIHECDLILFITDISQPLDEEEKHLLEKIKTIKGEKVVLFNKIDLGINEEKKRYILEFSEWTKEFSFSLVKEFDVSAFIGKLEGLIPETEGFYFPDDIISDTNDRTFFEEIILEKVYYYTYNEIPYSTYVEIILFSEEGENVVIEANVCIEKESQKHIIIGRDGSVIKRIRHAAQRELRKIYGQNITLNLFVKVDKNWTKNQHRLIDLGYARLHPSKRKKD